MDRTTHLRALTARVRTFETALTKVVSFVCSAGKTIPFGEALNLIVEIPRAALRSKGGR